MYAGFPKLQVTDAQPSVDIEHERTDENGCVKRTELPVPKTVNITFPAVCALLHSARPATSNQNVFGDVVGLQIGETVTISNVSVTPRTEVDRDDRTSEEEKMERQRKENELIRHDVASLQAAYGSEDLDTNVIGCFIVCSARFNPYSKQTMKKLRDLHNASLPAVLLVYDPFRTSLLGRPYIRAFTPTEAFYKYDVLMSKESGYGRRKGLAGFAKESGITKHGALDEITVKLDVDAYHKLNLLHLESSPSVDTFKAIESMAVGNYIESLLNSIRTGTEGLKTKLDFEGKGKDNASVPVGQDAETILLMKHIREQVDHLDAMCDSALLYSSMLRDL